MYRSNNAVIMQTEQLGRIETLEEELRSSKGKVADLEQKMMEHTGGKGSITQWVHAEYIVGSETICPPFTQQVRGGYFSKVPTKVPTG